MLKPTNSIVIYGWMVEGLHLQGTELLIYAIVYGFCQDGGQKKIALSYFQGWLTTTGRQAIRIVNALQSKGYIHVVRKHGKQGLYSIDRQAMAEAIRVAFELKEKEGKKEETIDLPSKGPNTLNDFAKEQYEKLRMEKELGQVKYDPEVADIIRNGNPWNF